MSIINNVWKDLVNGQQLSGLDILDRYQAKRESSIIHRLRKRYGYSAIDTTMTPNRDKTKRYAVYSLNKDFFYGKSF